MNTLSSARLIGRSRSLSPKLHLFNSPLRRNGILFCQCRSIKRSAVGQLHVRHTQQKPRSDFSVKRVEPLLSNLQWIENESWRNVDPVLLRDACICPQCVDPSTKQKNFQTTDIPQDITPRSARVSSDNSITIEWVRDIPGFEAGHVTILPENFFDLYTSRSKILQDRYQADIPRTWRKDHITREFQYVNYEDYMTTTEGLYRALLQLHDHGLLLVREVPASEKSVESIAGRIGTLRDSFYGRTWDVKSVPEARNVAYTAQYLGLHMDLLYMANPPGFQLLHCLKNTCEGGSSLFSDSFDAAQSLSEEDQSNLRDLVIPYHYRNAGEHYWYRHPVIEENEDFPNSVRHINYSPPFQAPHLHTSDQEFSGNPVFRPYFTSLKRFADKVESEGNLFEYRLQEGECVLFNNRRVLHGRRQFDAAHGERWLKGAYVDTDVFMSRWRVLREQWERKELRVDQEDYQFVFPN